MILPKEINKKIARELALFGKLNIREIGTFKVKKYKKKLLNGAKDTMTERDCIGISFIPSKNLKKVIPR